MSRSTNPSGVTSPRGSRLLRRVVLAAAAAGLVGAGVVLVAPGLGSDPDAQDAATSEVVEPGGDPAAGRGDGVTEGDRAPDVAFERFDGDEPAQLDDWAGEPVVVNFWASWCPPCVAEMRDAFQPVHQDLGDQVQFLGVNLQDPEDAAVAVVDETGVTYDLARDPDGELFAAFGGFGMPMTAFVDEEGEVVATHTGAMTRDQLEGLVVGELIDP